MASNIRVVVDEPKRGLVIRWFEDGLERHVWVDHGRFEELLASGETVYARFQHRGSANDDTEQATARRQAQAQLPTES
jgi:hypothetical protein